MKYSKAALCVFIIFCIPSFALAAVSINEIAWMGTSESTSNEWIELANNEGVPVDLTGWVLSIEGKKDVSLLGNIGANSFYLIERTDDTTVPTVPADLVASFGTGISNTGAVLSLKNMSGVVLDRVDGSKEWNIDGVVAGNNTTKETAQKGASGWFTGTPTPRALNAEGTGVTPSEQPVNMTPDVIPTPTNTSSFSTLPQIIADAGAAVRTVSVGAPITFTGHVFGLKKEPLENARLVWSFGDGTAGEGISVPHNYYYPGDYIVVLDASSGYYSASDRASVHVTAPLLSLHTGGDTTRSFVAIQNNEADEIDLSLWQIVSERKTFIIPQSTILGARKSLTLASEVSGLATPAGSIVFLNFPNGSRVEMQKTISEAVPPVKVLDTPTAKIAPTSMPVHAVVIPANNQEAAVLNALSGAQPLPSTQDERSMWPWYIGAAFLAALALLGLRLTREKELNSEITADDFEIIEDEEPH